MESNPYSSPEANVFGGSNDTNATVTEGVLFQLRGTKGWVKLMAVLLFIGAGMMLLGALAMGVAGAFGGFAAAEAEGVPGIAGLVGGVAMAAFYGVFGILYLYPALRLWNFGSKIDDLLKDQSSLTLESALNEQRKFWKFIGVLTIAMMALWVLAVIGMIAVGGFAAAAAAAAAGSGAL